MLMQGLLLVKANSRLQPEEEKPSRSVLWQSLEGGEGSASSDMLVPSSAVALSLAASHFETLKGLCLLSSTYNFVS